MNAPVVTPKAERAFVEQYTCPFCDAAPGRSCASHSRADGRTAGATYVHGVHVARVKRAAENQQGRSASTGWGMSFPLDSEHVPLVLRMALDACATMKEELDAAHARIDEMQLAQMPTLNSIQRMDLVNAAFQLTYAADVLGRGRNRDLARRCRTGADAIRALLKETER